MHLGVDCARAYSEKPFRAPLNGGFSFDDVTAKRGFLKPSEVIGAYSGYPSASEDLGAQNDLKRSNMATTSKSPLPPRPQSVPLLRKTMSPDPSNVKASPTRAKTPLV